MSEYERIWEDKVVELRAKIERLRADNDKLRKEADRLADTNSHLAARDRRLHADKAELLAALEDIAEQEPTSLTSQLARAAIAKAESK